VPIGAAAFLLRRRRRPPAIPYPSTRSIRPARTLRIRLAGLPTGLRVLAVMLIVLALARPRLGEATSAVHRQGIAIQMVLDRSGSMEEEMASEGRPMRKIEIVKSIFRDFVAGGEELPGRESDLLGLTTFARFAEENCPLVSLHEPLLTTVANLKTVPPFITAARVPTWDRREAADQNPLSATAIGEGLKRAVLALVAAEEDLARGRDRGEETYEIKGKVVILLTDGQQNAGADPLSAADLARANGIRVYTIVMFDRNVVMETPFGQRIERRLGDREMEQVVGVPREIAERTGGRTFLAEDGDALRRIYEEIDRLERVDIGEVTFRTWHERFHLPLLAGVILLLLCQLLEETWLRRTP
jgi:Ca-activated chloride channel family protein